MIRHAGGVAAWLAAAAVALGAAQSGGKPTTGNPTPGTAQPDPPNLGDRITITGCLRPAPGANAAAPDPNEPSDSRFVLTSAQRLERVPPGTGGSPLTAKISSRTFRLEGIDSQFTAFVGTKVEVSGEIRPPGAPPRAEAQAAPTLVVEFIQKIDARC